MSSGCDRLLCLLPCGACTQETRELILVLYPCLSVGCSPSLAGSLLHMLLDRQASSTKETYGKLTQATGQNGKYHSTQPSFSQGASNTQVVMPAVVTSLKRGWVKGFHQINNRNTSEASYKLNCIVSYRSDVHSVGSLYLKPRKRRMLLEK